MNNKNVKLVTCYANLFLTKHESYIYKPKGGDVKDFIKSNCALGSAMFRKKDWDFVGGYDETMVNGFEDWEFYIRLLEASGITTVIKEPLYNYRKRENTTTSKANNNRSEIINYIYTKHRSIVIIYYNEVIKHLLENIHSEEKEKLKNLSRIEFKIGKGILRPFRLIKSFFK